MNLRTRLAGWGAPRRIAYRRPEVGAATAAQLDVLHDAAEHEAMAAWLAGAEQPVFADPGTGLTVTLRPGLPPETVPSGALEDRYEIRTASPVRRPAALMLTAAEFGALAQWLNSTKPAPASVGGGLGRRSSA